MKSNIRNLRNEKQISQTTLANILGKTQQTVSHMERDRDRISIESLITMSDYFGVSTDYILGVESKDRSKEDNANENMEPQKSEETGDEKSSRLNQDGENKKVLYQLILSLLLRSLEDDARVVIKAQESNA